ncbi:NAD(P)-dependent oxidoreductase [Atopobacter sp. AH10]|uniref:NAD(P)-dependent oxidoreductase n=1 Tax=Atopobacter sp. AH10 TaxID=2315861 RepID=UPI000EF18B55|nr:NAD(P)-dependent oxidoreductase [Atopobacter sp. AH10]RLK62996.1 NAD(P)-dependent oxidoreductase [Atopobacter sp. AH10]
MATIGFIGTGVMGSAMASHLLDAGHSLTVYTRTKSKADELVKSGALWADSPKEVVEASDFILSIVGYPSDVEEIYFGEGGIFEADVKGKYLIDLTTSTPTLAKIIAKEAKARQAFAFDAPVSGGDLGAQRGQLTCMVGGPEEGFEQILPILEVFSTTVIRQGNNGAGQHTKMANQIMIAGTMTGMTELLVYAQKAGLNLKKVLDTVGAGSAANWSLTNYAPRIMQDNYSPGFFVKHFLKDLKIALDEAEKMELDLPATRVAKELYERLANEGHADEGTQALIKLWWREKGQA